MQSEGRELAMTAARLESTAVEAMLKLEELSREGRELESAEAALSAYFAAERAAKAAAASSRNALKAWRRMLEGRTEQPASDDDAEPDPDGHLAAARRIAREMQQRGSEVETTFTRVQ